MLTLLILVFRYKISIVRNRITSKAAFSDCLEAAIQSHSFLKTSLENTVDKIFLLVKLHKANRKPTKVVKHVDPCDVYEYPIQQPNSKIHYRMATLLPSSNFLHKIAGLYPNLSK